MTRSVAATVVAVLCLAACGGRQLAGAGAPFAPAGGMSSPARAARPARSPIEHVIVVVQENRSFDNLFMGFPGADWSKTGETHTGKEVPLKPITLQTTGRLGLGTTLPDMLGTFTTEWNETKMNGFDLIHFGADGLGPPAKRYPYAYVVRSETKPYWNLAHDYALADKMFGTEKAGAFANDLVLVAASTEVGNGLYAVGVQRGVSDGCNGRQGRTVLSNGKLGPRPCFNWKSMATLLDGKGVSWRYYTESCREDYGCYWDAYQAIKPVREGRDWTRNVVHPNSRIFDDLKGANFPAVAWVTPTLAESDDSASASKSGPEWVDSIVNAVKTSRYWKSTAIVVVWSNWGGYYDNVVPPEKNTIAYGLRVPMLMISPYSKRGYVSHTQYDLTSILRFIEDNWQLGTLGKFDESANSVGDMLTVN